MKTNTDDLDVQTGIDMDLYALYKTCFSIFIRCGLRCKNNNISYQSECDPPLLMPEHETKSSAVLQMFYK